MKSSESETAVPISSIEASTSPQSMSSPSASPPSISRHRYAALIYVLALLTWLVLGVAMQCTADSTPAGDGEPSLEDVLTKGLRARRPAEFKFVSNVCDSVQRGEIPRSLVQRTFLWARRKNKHPFQYFERAMQIQAEKLGVVL